MSVAAIKARVEGGWYNIGTGVLEEDEVVAGPPGGWQAAYDSGSFAAKQLWYQTYTGHLTEDFEAGMLWSPDDDPTADIMVNESWLEANEGANVIHTPGSTFDWTVIGLHASYIRVAVANINFKHCFVFREDYATQWGSGVTVYDPVMATYDAVTLDNIVFDNCTIATDGTGTEISPGVGTYGDAMTYVQSEARPNGITFNFCEVYEWRAGFLSWSGTNVNYCYVHDLDIFGTDPHNTSASIRGAHTHLYRCMFLDGTSSDVSLYADTTPYTNFSVIECIMKVAPESAIYEVNFPIRGTGWHVLEPGYSRILKGNQFERGTASDLQYFTEVSGNTLYDGTELFGGADRPEDRATGTPSVLAGFGGFAGYANPSENMTTFPFTPTDNSTLFLFHGIGQAGHDTAPNPTVSDDSGDTWTKVTNTQTPIENAAANLSQYGVSSVLWQVETGIGETFRKVTVDPYATTAQAYESMLIVEMTGVTDMVLAQPRALSGEGHSLAFGATQRTVSSGSLGSPATLGNDVFFCVSYRHNTDLDEATEPVVPTDWELVGCIREKQNSVAVFWRNDFNGMSVSISDLGVDAEAVVTTLVEFSS